MEMMGMGMMEDTNNVDLATLSVVSQAARIGEWDLFKLVMDRGGDLHLGIRFPLVLFRFPASFHHQLLYIPFLHPRCFNAACTARQVLLVCILHHSRAHYSPTLYPTHF